jgi:hypothetical protein
VHRRLVLDLEHAAFDLKHVARCPKALSSLP